MVTFLEGISIGYIANSIIASIVFTIIIFTIGYFSAMIPKVKISKKIIRGMMDFDGGYKLSYIFKIVNTSHFLKARDFTVKLFAVKHIERDENTYTENYTEIEGLKYKGLDELAKYNFKCMIKRKMKTRMGNNDFSCWYTIITTEDIFEKYKDYQRFRLSVRYKTSMNQEFIVNQYFVKPDKIDIGYFSLDGDLNTVMKFSKEDQEKFEGLKFEKTLRRPHPSHRRCIANHRRR